MSIPSASSPDFTEKKSWVNVFVCSVLGLDPVVANSVSVEHSLCRKGRGLHNLAIRGARVLCFIAVKQK